MKMYHVSAGSNVVLCRGLCSVFVTLYDVFPASLADARRQAYSIYNMLKCVTRKHL